MHPRSRRSPWPWLAVPAALLLLLTLTNPDRQAFAEWLNDYRVDHGQPPPSASILTLPVLAGDERAQNWLLFTLFFVRDDARHETPLVALGVLRQIVQVGPVPAPPPASLTASPPSRPPDVTPLYVPNGPTIPPLPDPQTLAQGSHITITWLLSSENYTAGHVKNDGSELIQGLQLAAKGSVVRWTAPGDPRANLGSRDVAPGETASFVLQRPLLLLPSGAQLIDAAGRAVPYDEHPYQNAPSR